MDKAPAALITQGRTCVLTAGRHLELVSSRAYYGAFPGTFDLPMARVVEAPLWRTTGIRAGNACAMPKLFAVSTLPEVIRTQRPRERCGFEDYPPLNVDNADAK